MKFMVILGNYTTNFEFKKQKKIEVVVFKIFKKMCFWWDMGVFFYVGVDALDLNDPSEIYGNFRK